MRSEVVTARNPWQPCEKEGWILLQVKRRFNIELGKMLQNGPIGALDQEVPYLKAQHVQWDWVQLSQLPTMWASPSDIENLRLALGDLLVCEGGEVGRAAIIQEDPPQDCIIQNALHRVRSIQDDEIRFLGYLLRHAATQGWLEVLCNRSTFAHFTVDKFGEMWISLPNSQVQRYLADYLDKEIAQLDELITAKERVLELLAEKRRVIISDAILRCQGCGPVRDSGIPWLGQIPAHWQTERTRWLFKERDQRSETGDEELLTVSHITGVTPRSEKDVNMFEAETTEGYKICLAGDLVINTLWAWMGAMGISPVKGIVSPAYNVYEPGPRLAPMYVDALVRMPIFAQEVTRYSKGVWSSRLRLYPEGFFEVILPVPPLEEQLTIVKHIATETIQLDAMRAATERTIALLRERRDALIATAVTGELHLN